MSSGKRRPFCFGPNMLVVLETIVHTCRLLWKSITYKGYLHGMHQMVVLCGQSRQALWISGRPVLIYNPLRGRAIQHDPRNRPMGDTTLEESEHDKMENMFIT